LLYGAVAY